jgi:acetylornithine/N-succinyldiaminopimelate aminotransferase
MNHLMDTVDRKPVTFCGGVGSWLVSDGNQKPYLDFFTDVGTASLGYGGPEISTAFQRAINKSIHAPNIFGFVERDIAAKKLCDATDMDRVFFCNSGTEAVEAAIKIARKYQFDRGTNRQIIYSYRGGFHGRTYGALAAGDGPRYHYDGFGPLPEGFKHFDYVDNIEPEAAAVIVAPIFGNGDVRLYDGKTLQWLRQYTADNEIILIFDEVQTGAGRSGYINYAQGIGIIPDVVCMAKGMAMGAPVGSMLARGEVADAFTPGSHFSTFGGSPFASVFVSAMLDWLTPENLADVRSKGAYLRQELENAPWAKNVRGDGLLNAFDIDVDVREFADRCLRIGLILGVFRDGPGVIKITPPLNVTMDELKMGLMIMGTVYREMTK